MNVKTKERIIKYLLSKERQYTNNQLYVEVSRNSLLKSNIADIKEAEFMKQLSLLETNGLITVNFRTGYRDLSYTISVILHSGIINYFDDKKIRTRANLREKVRTYLPVVISTLALLKSYGIDFILLGKQLLKLLLKK